MQSGIQGFSDVRRYDRNRSRKSALGKNLADFRWPILRGSRELSLSPQAEAMSFTLNLPNQQPLVDTYFDSVAPQWNELYHERGLKPTIFAYRQSLGLQWLTQSVTLSGADVLDVGCGAGPASVALARRGARVKAIDTVPRMVSLTRRSAREAAVSELIDASIGDVHALRFADQSFHAVVAIGVLYWLHSPEKALREIMRVLKPGGFLVVSADNARRLTYTLDPGHLDAVVAVRRLIGRRLRSWGWRKAASSIQVNRYSIDQFDQLLASSGFEKLKSISIGFGPFSLFEWKLIPDSIGLKLHSLLQNMAEHHHPVLSGSGNHYLALARKPVC